MRHQCRPITNVQHILYSSRTEAINEHFSQKRTMWAMILSLCREGCRLKRTMSPSIMCLSTVSPNLSSWAIFSRFPYFRNLRERQETSLAVKHIKYFIYVIRCQSHLFICVWRFWIKLAPGWTSGPLRTSFLISSRFALFTYSTIM